jgi:plastocyanin
MKNTAFNPNTLTIRVGTTVTWSNDETSPIPHTVTSGSPNALSGMFDSGDLNPGQTFQFTFNAPGTFQYFCRIHGAAMTGTVTVTQ